MSNYPTFTLNNGIEMPQLGLGVFQMDDEQVRAAVPAAIEAGYRLIDTASRYYNEKAVGQAIAESSIPREKLFITTKLWFKDHGYEQTKKAFEVSLTNLGLDYLDLYLIHQPFGDYYGAWRALEELYTEGRIRAIGVSNFYPDRFYDLALNNLVPPAVNQRRLNPFDQQRNIRELSSRYDTVLQAWAPLGQGDTDLLNDPTLTSLSTKYGKSVPQIILRWLTQSGVAAVVKSTRMERLRENLNVFDVELTAEEIALIDGLDRCQTQTTGPNHQAPEMLDRLLTFE